MCLDSVIPFKVTHLRYKHETLSPGTVFHFSRESQSLCSVDWQYGLTLSNEMKGNTPCTRNPYIFEQI